LFPKTKPTESVAVVTRFPYWSRTSTVTAGLIVIPATTVLGWVEKPNCVAAPGVPVAVMLTGDNEPLVAVSVFTPAVVPKVQAGLVATPALSVVTVPLAPKDPDPLAGANVTDTPLTTLPCASVTFTDGAVATAVPTVALCPVPPFTAIVVAAPALTVTLEESTALNTGTDVKRIT
jgi:hypothetical protein